MLSVLLRKPAMSHSTPHAAAVYLSNMHAVFSTHSHDYLKLEYVFKMVYSTAVRVHKQTIYVQDVCSSNAMKHIQLTLLIEKIYIITFLYLGTDCL